MNHASFASSRHNCCLEVFAGLSQGLVMDRLRLIEPLHVAGGLRPARQYSKEYAVDAIDRYLKEVAEMVAALPRGDIRRVVQAIQETRDRNGQIFLLGNGGSASLASHMACDLAKTSIVPGVRRIRAIALTDNVALMTAWANDSAYEDIFAEQLINLVLPRDLVIAVSGSGNSPNVLKAVDVARTAGALTVGFTGRPGGRLKDMVDISVVVPSSRIEVAEDGHLILDHVISVALRAAEMVTAPSGDGGTRKRG